MSSDHRARHAREDARNEAAFLRKMVKHEAEVRASERRRMWVRMDPIFQNPKPVEDLPDFPGCYW